MTRRQPASAPVPLPSVGCDPEVGTCGQRGVVLLVRDSSGRRRASQVNIVASTLRRVGLSALTIDVTPHDASGRTDVMTVARRIAVMTDWLTDQPRLTGRRIGLFGVGPAGAAALVAAIQRPAAIRAIVSLDAGSDLSSDALPWVSAPALLIAKDRDGSVIELNRKAMGRLGGPRQLEIVSDAKRRFDSINWQIAELTANWFLRHLAPATA